MCRWTHRKKSIPQVRQSTTAPKWRYPSPSSCFEQMEKFASLNAFQLFLESPSLRPLKMPCEAWSKMRIGASEHKTPVFFAPLRKKYSITFKFLKRSLSVEILIDRAKNRAKGSSTCQPPVLSHGNAWTSRFCWRSTVPIGPSDSSVQTQRARKHAHLTSSGPRSR